MILSLGLMGMFFSISCISEYEGISPDPTLIHYPIGLAVHPSGRYLYVANSNFDLAFTGGTLMVFDTAEDEEITSDFLGVKTTYKTLKRMEGSTVEIGSFAGQMLLSKDGTRGYLAVRNDRREGGAIGFSEIMYFDINVDKTGAEHLSCAQKAIAKENTGGVGAEGKYDIEPAPRCGDQNKVFLLGNRCESDSDCVFARQERCLRDTLTGQGTGTGYCSTNFYPYGLSLASVCTARRTCLQDSDCACSAEAKQSGLCQADERCDSGRCTAGCASDTDCAEGQTCSLGRCRYKLPSGKACTTDTQCLIEERCENSVCVTRTCTAATECPSEYACVSGKCTRKACTQDIDCPTGTRCDNARCVEGCSTSGACGQGEACENGRCRVPLPDKTPYCEDNTDCASYEQCKEKRLFASLLEQGGYASLDLEKLTLPSTSIERRELGLIEDKTALGLPLGMTGITLLPNHTELGGHGELFLVSRQSNRVYALPLKDQELVTRDIGQVLFSNTDMVIPPSTTVQADMRGLAVAINKKHGWARLYVSSRLPSVVLVYDLIRERPDLPLTMRLVATLPVGAEPAHLVYRHRPAPYPDLLYVVCSRRGRVDVIDVEAMQTIYQIPVGERPYFMAIHDPPAGTPNPKPRAYIANFLNTTISIVDLNNHQVVGLVKGIDTTLRVNP